MPTGGGSTQRTVTAPTQGNIQDAINSLLEQSLQPATPANFAYTIKDFYSVDHAMLSVGMSAQWMSGNAHASLSLDSDDVTHNYLVQVTQQYYSIAVQPPNQSDDFFATTVTPDDLRNYVGPGNPPLYVSSITYGRQLFIFARSHTHSGKLRAALDGSFSSGTAGGKFDAKGESAQLINESEITVFALGGASAGVPIPLVGDKATSISAYVDAGKNFNPATSPGSPLSYVCTYLHDSTTASISFSTDYTANTISQVIQSDDWNPSSSIFGERENHDFAITMPDGFMWDGDIQFLRNNLIEYNQRGGATQHHSLWVDGVPTMQNDGKLHVNVHTGWPGAGSTSIRVQARCVSSPNA
jgi:thiol-activated cytolysin